MESERDRAARSWKRGFGDAFTQAGVLVLTPTFFGFLGWLADRALGTGPLFLLLLGAFGFVGTLLSTYYRYVAELERARPEPWHRARPSEPSPADVRAPFPGPLPGRGAPR